MSRGSRSAPVALCLMASLALAACTGTPNEGDAQTVASPTTIDASSVEEGATAKDRIRGLARAYGIQKLPDVQVVREVTTFEQPQVVADCLTEAGFPTEVADDGSGWGGQMLKEQEQEHKEATIGCLLQYPLMQRYLEPETDDQFQVRYEWTRDQVIPCMEELGYDPGPMPSLDTYIWDARSGGGLWQPTREIDPEFLGQLTREMDQSCPPVNPPLDQLWPDG